MADVSKIKLPSGTTYNIKDTVSGYTTNTGTITKVQTTAGAHTTINVSSGAAAFNVPTKTSHLTNDSGFITNAGVTGVKGNAESSYRTGQVNLTAANIGAVDKAGDTMTGNLIVPATKIANTYYGISFGRTTDTPIETVLYTGIKWIHAKHMPVIHITGYAYGLQSPVEFKIGFYLYGDPTCKIGWCGVTNMGAWAPEVYLFKYTRDNVEYVAVGFKGSCYFLQLQADLQDEMGKFGYVETASSFWSWSFSTNAGVIPEADEGTTCIQVPYKANILNPTTVNGHTVNADVPSGATFTDDKVSQSYKTASEYTYWRPLLIGYSSGSAATFTPSSVTNLAYTFSTLKVQPSTGTIRINNLALYKGSYTTTFTPTTLTADRTITVPNASGTMALTSDIPDISGKIDTAGTGLSKSGTTLNHSNSVTAQTTQALYPIKIDAQGHISAYGTAVTSLPASDVSSWAKASSKPSYTFSEIGSKPTTISGYGITDAYTKTEVDNKVSAVLRYKGVKAAVANLPTTGNTTGDVWHVTATSGEYAWDGTEWQELGTAISIPAATGSSTTGISIAAHGTGTVTGVQSSTTSVRGVKTGTDSTTTASKVTLGTAISVPNVTGNSDVTVPIRADADTTVPTAASSATTVPIKATSATTVPIKNTSATSIPNVTAVGSGSASLTFTMDTTDTKKLKIAFSHTHTAPTLGTEISIIGVQSSTTSVTGVQSSTTSVTGVSGSTTVRGVKTGTNSTTTASKVTLGTAKSIPNVTAATDVTVPIRADADTTVPIKNTSASTFVTGTTHTVTDNGHTHTI